MSVLRSTKAPISMRNGTLQLKVALEISGEPRLEYGDSAALCLPDYDRLS